MKKNGFSLIEVVVGLGILLVGVIPILSMYPSMTRMNQKIREADERIRLTQTAINYIKTLGYLEVKSIVDDPTSGIKDGLKFNLVEDENLEGVYTSNSFETTFDCENLFSLYAKGASLEGAVIWVMLNPGRVESANAAVLNPANGTVWLDKVLVGGVVVGMGEDDTSTRTGKKSEYELLFELTVLEDYPR